MASVSLERVVHLETQDLEMREELFIAMPNIEVLMLQGVRLSDGFLQPDQAGPYAYAKLFPSLRLLRLEDVKADAGWRPLVDYLIHQTSNGQAISLELMGGLADDLPLEVLEEVENLVEELHCRDGPSDDYY